MPRLELDQLTKVYPAGVRALDRVSLTVEGEELVVLVGPSGCGKTTLLRLLAGLESPTEGRILLGGKDLADIPPARRGVSMVFQDHALYPSRSVRDNLAYPLQLLRTPKAEIDSVVRETAERLGLSDVLKVRPGELSGGQRQRVALGRALVRRPALFLFDEPLSSLDAGMRRQLRRLIKQVQRESKTPAVYVTHDQEEALALADRLVVLDLGRVRQIGPPRAVHDQPADCFVAGFVGSAMNFLAGRLESTDGKRMRLIHSHGALEGFDLPANWSGRSITLAFRPESVHLGMVADWPTLMGRVVLIEYQGDRIGVTFDSGFTLSGCFDGKETFREADKITLSLPPNRCLWFEPGPDGRALILGETWGT